ncbi:atrial natriuretic peptide receptor 1-like [Actinia tenebrosa]|uniref:Guanylate cyclase n=1 Tax=Actinia tenebrosa TaxID=6105 RepID=A0A6P8J4B6_ACTTE|nr:atrial natriuretic peptide receptor 1-like [Actinia tenebrosa]
MAFHYILYFSTVLAIFFVTSKVTSQDEKEIKIGVLLPMVGYWPIGTRTAASVPLAVHDIMQNKSILPGYNISYQIHDSGCNKEKGIRGMVNYQEMDVIIGPACSTAMEPVALLAKIWDKPIITYAASARKFLDKEVFSTTSTVTAYGRRNTYHTTSFVAGLMRAFNWTVCGILSSSEIEWKTLATEIRDAITPAVEIPIFENFYKNLKKETLLTKAKERVRVILLLCYVNDVAEFMYAAKKLGMTDGSYAFVTIDLNTDVFYSNNNWTGNEGPGTQYDQGLDGILDLSVKRPVLTRDFLGRYHGMKSSLPSHIQSQLIDNPSWYAAFLYDALWLAGLALNATISEGFGVKNTSTAVKHLFNLNFPGESGQVVMVNGTRVPSFVVGNFRHGLYVPIINHSIFLTKEDLTSRRLLFDSNIVWPGGTTNIPKSTPGCGFDGELCKENASSHDEHYTLTISLTVFGCCLLLVLILYIRKRQMDKESMFKTWLLNYTDLTPCYDEQDEVGGQKSHIHINQFSTSQTPTLLLRDSDKISTGHPLQPIFTAALYQGKKVYVKRLHHDVLNITRLIKNEIRQACELRHVNINPYLGVCVEPLDLCIVSEYCTKGRLKDILLDEYLKLDWNFKMSFSTDIARGMEELHKSNIGYHGNLKSTNIVVDGYWICKIADFGLRAFKSGNRGTLVKEDTLFSDMLWTAPEQLRNTVDTGHAQSGDVYSYGIILQEIVLREKPYSTSLLGPKEIIHHVKKGLKPHCRPNIPPDSAPGTFRELMTMCWDETPERRPTFSGVLKILKKINKGKATNIVDNMLSMMEKYTNNLESLVKERTRQLETEKAKTDELLYKMMPRSVADQLKTGLQMKAESYEHVTVFFSEILGFAEIAEQSSPIELINLLNDLYSLYDTVISRYHVFKVETMCDSYLVVSGLPERNGKRHAAEIASMALHLLFYFKDFKIQHLTDQSLEFKMGIHTGPCVAGIVGLKTPRYDIFGETVNVAKQLEATGLPQHIHMSEKCKSFLEEIGGFTYEARHNILVKGLGETTTYVLSGKSLK